MRPRVLTSLITMQPTANQTVQQRYENPEKQSECLTLRRVTAAAAAMNQETRAAAHVARGGAQGVSASRRRSRKQEGRGQRIIEAAGSGLRVGHATEGLAVANGVAGTRQGPDISLALAEQTTGPNRAGNAQK